MGKINILQACKKGLSFQNGKQPIIHTHSSTHHSAAQAVFSFSLYKEKSIGRKSPDLMVPIQQLKCCFTRQMNEKIPHSLLFARSLIPLFYLKQASMKWKPRSFSKTFSYVLFGIYEYFA